MGEGNIFSLFTLAEGGGYPIPGLLGGYPIPGVDGGYPISGLGVGTPTQVWVEGYPIPGLDGGGGTWGTPLHHHHHPKLDGVPPTPTH